MALLVADKLAIVTDIGECSIELCFGDITKLPREEGVDVLVVSAFAGDYSPTPTSLIGALHNKLGVSVRALSKDKEEDLRKQFFCWWSKLLPDECSFKRILCFEGGFGRRGTTPPQVVGAVFRCLVPILNNKEGTVMMPLLASGDQGYCKTLMLRLLVDSAVKWMKTGLPLRNLKIVVYSPRPKENDFPKDPLFQCFGKLKVKHEERVVDPKETKDTFDVYLSHSSEDHDTAAEVAKYFESHSKDLRVFCNVQTLNAEESWQEEMFEVISTCSRVIVLLSPSFLESAYCIEQYNIALCIGRRLHREFLAPFFIASVSYLPTYMGLVQYIDCRPRCAEKIKDASVTIAKWCQASTSETSKNTLPISPAPLSSDAYDVFISYSHSNTTIATKILESLQALDSTLKIFIDSAELKTGTSWQQSLYLAIGTSRRVVVLLSAPYLQSKVCHEEFSLALALNLDKRSELQLTSLLVEKLGNLPVWCSEPLPIDCVGTEEINEARIKAVCEDLVQGLNGRSDTADDLQGRLESLREKNMSLEELSEMFRKVCFVARQDNLDNRHVLTSSDNHQQVGHSTDVAFGVSNSHNSLGTVRDEGDVSKTMGTEVQKTNSCDVALSYAPEDSIFASALKRFLFDGCPNIKIGEPQVNASARLSSLDEARLIVPLLSPAYLLANHLVDELNIALYRHRSSSQQVVLPVRVAVLPFKPAYIHLIPCEFSVLDLSWALLHSQALPEEVERTADELDIDHDAAFCLKSVADVILSQLKGDGSQQEACSQVLLNPAEVTHVWERFKKQVENEKSGELRKLFGLESLSVQSNSVNSRDEDKNGKTEPLEDNGKKRTAENEQVTACKEVPDRTHEEEKPMAEVPLPRSVDSLNENKDRQRNLEDGPVKIGGRKKCAKACYLV